MGWTDERVELLKKLWQEGLSASQIAKQLGGVTRNAVIGKVHRLGLSGPAAPPPPSRSPFKAPRPPLQPAPPSPTRPTFKPPRPPRPIPMPARRPRAMEPPAAHAVPAVRQAPFVE